MRYLNKIIFINSASIKYADVSIDGNVHFIGTQGVGKSTLLRAILFFYNADKIKLGIAKEKKNFDEYYFPYQNSYIIYEVIKETGPFCILAFKAQGRVAFRFFDAAFNKNYFIDNEGKAFEIWDKTRVAFSKDNIGYTRIINNYEEFRNILYGNTKGLATEFRKYAIVESKQYQNIPRTIQNVFLNSKLDAAFIKETIIKSLNEDDITIDLANYQNNHLRDFETNLNDIKKWTERNRSGEYILEKQATKIAQFYAALNYLEKEKIDLAKQLGWAINNVEIEMPKFIKNLEDENFNLQKIKTKLSIIDDAYKTKERKLNGEISVLKRDLDTIKNKKEEYQNLKIDSIIERVAKKNYIETNKQNLLNEKDILTSKFFAIKQRYEALLVQLENGLKEFENNKLSENNIAAKSFLQHKEHINKEYEQLIEDIRNQYRQELQIAKGLIDENKNVINNLKLKKTELKYKPFYEAEIKAAKTGLATLIEVIKNAETEIVKDNDKIKNIQKEWQLDDENIKRIALIDIEKQNETQTKIAKNIAAINLKIENSKDSFYDWLNNEIPNWNNTIGKVIDEENVLFKPDLNPTIISKESTSFYGINIDLSAIQKTVKTVDDYEKDKAIFNQQLDVAKQNIAALNNSLIDDIERLKKKFQPKIKELKEAILQNEYNKEQQQIKLDEVNIALQELIKKVTSEKYFALQQTDDAIEKAIENEIIAIQNLENLEQNINKQVDVKKKEKEQKIKQEHQKLDEKIAIIDAEIKEQTSATLVRIAEQKGKQNKEFEDNGAKTNRINEIDAAIAEITTELKIIAENISIVERYKYDKEQLFDKETDFKNRKNLLEKQFETELIKHQQQKQKLYEEQKSSETIITEISKTIGVLEQDLKAFSDFKLSDIFATIDTFYAAFTSQNKTEKYCVNIIAELNAAHYKSIDRYNDLHETIAKFNNNFTENNIFSFKTKLDERKDYIEFAEMLKDFVEADKIDEYKKRVEERFAHIIRQIGKETEAIISKEGEIDKVISEINNDFVARKFVQAIKSVELKIKQSENKIFALLVQIKDFNKENIFALGKPNLFSNEGQTNKNERAVELLKQLIKEMAVAKEKEISLSDSFDLQFRIIENDNDTNWVEKLANVGSEGTDVLVKAMINIMLLNVFKERATKKKSVDFRLHCMMDEIGKLHPNNVKGILKFANDRNILLINSSPTTYNSTDYKYTFLLSKDAKNVTTVKRLVRKIATTTEEN